MAKPSEIFVGATVAVAQDWAQYAAGVKISKSVTTDKTRERKLEEGTTLRHEQAAALPTAYPDSTVPNITDFADNQLYHPGTAVLASAHVMDNAGNVLYSQAAPSPHERGKVALPLLRFLMETFPRQFGSSLRYSDAEPDSIVFGFNVKHVLRIAALEVFKRNAADPAHATAVPVRLWHNPVGCYDPLDVVIPSADRKSFDLYSLFKYLDIQVDLEKITTSAEMLAKAAQAVAVKAQLFVPK